jgi:hypothetical protein
VGLSVLPPLLLLMPVLLLLLLLLAVGSNGSAGLGICMGPTERGRLLLVLLGLVLVSSRGFVLLLLVLLLLLLVVGSLGDDTAATSPVIFMPLLASCFCIEVCLMTGFCVGPPLLPLLVSRVLPSCHG